MIRLTREEKRAYHLYERYGFDKAIRVLVTKHGYTEDKADDLVMLVAKKISGK